jgi:hypothetical protein
MSSYDNEKMGTMARQWYMPIMPALGELRQDHSELEASLGYTARPCKKTSRLWWLIPIFLAIPETKNGRIMV